MVAVEDLPSVPEPSIRADIKAYEEMEADLSSRALGKWALVQERQLVAVFESFNEAASVAVERFGRGPYLIRQIGSHGTTVPIGVMYGSVHALHALRL